MAEAKRTTEENEKRAVKFFERLKKYALADQAGTASVPAPGCAQQPPFAPLGHPGGSTTYQHVFEQLGE